MRWRIRLVRCRIGFVRRRIHFGAPGFTQRGLLVLLELFFLAARASGSRSLGAISSVVRLECHCDARWLIPPWWALYMHPAMPAQHHVVASTTWCIEMGASNSIHPSGTDHQDRMATRQERIGAFTHDGVPPP